MKRGPLSVCACARQLTPPGVLSACTCRPLTVGRAPWGNRFNDFAAMDADMKSDLFFLSADFAASLPVLPAGGVSSWWSASTEPDSEFVQVLHPSTISFLTSVGAHRE